MAAVLGAELHGRHVVQAKWDAYNVALAIKTKELIDQRDADNQRLATIQKSTSIKIQKAHDDEITKVRADPANSQRLRIGTAICGGVARPAETSSASGSNAADTGGGILSKEMDAAIKSLILETEEAAATGRAAQAFIRGNGMVEN